MYTLYAMLKEELEFVRLRIKQYYDKHKLKGPRLERRDKVYLILRNLRTKRLSKKLDFKKVRLFKVDKQISDNNFRLLLLANDEAKDIRFLYFTFRTSTKGCIACYERRS